MFSHSSLPVLASTKLNRTVLGEKRSLKDVSTEQALAMLNNILRAKWQDNQLNAMSKMGYAYAYLLTILLRGFLEVRSK